MKSSTALVAVVAAAAIGGGIYVASRKDDKKPPPAPPPPGSTGLPDYVPQSLVDSYTRCYTTGCTAVEFQQVLTGLQGLMNLHPELEAQWTYFVNELLKRAPEDHTPVPGLPLDGGINTTYQTQFDKCWFWNCTLGETNALLDALHQEYLKNATDHPNVASILETDARLLALRYGMNRSTSGVVGRHTGGCMCQARQMVPVEEERHTGHGACCDSCARGEACNECEG